ncbi:MAG: acyl-CoA synthetase [Candidatus Tectimicrobiota bacterium]
MTAYSLVEKPAVRNLEDYRRLCEAWRWSIPPHYNIAADCVDKHAADPARRDHPALIWENAAGQTLRYSFAEMSELTSRFAHALRELGIEPRQRILLRLPNVPAFQIAFLGALKAGAVPIPSSVMFRTEEVRHRLTDSRATAVVTTAEHLPEAVEAAEACPAVRWMLIDGPLPRPAPTRVVSLDEALARPSPPSPLPPTCPDEVAYICYTSGTTGEPRGVVHTHQSVLGKDPAVLWWQDLRPTDRVAHSGHLSWTYPLGFGFLYPWRHGVTTVCYDGPFDPHHWYALLARHEVTVFMSVPTVYRKMLSEVAEAPGLPRLRHALSAGEPLPPEVFEAWVGRHALPLYEGFGMSEFSLFVTNLVGLPLKPGSCGLSQPGHRCAVLDEAGRELPPGEVGLLAVGRDSPACMRGYWDKPEETRAVFHDGWLVAGDTVRRDEEGYFWFVARSDDMITSAGYRIAPGEVEAVAARHEAVLEAAAVGAPDALRGQVVKLFVVLEAGYEPTEALATSIQQFCKDHAAPYKYPRQVAFIGAIPKTPNGKVKRQALREEA